LIKDWEIIMFKREGLGYPQIAPELVSVKIKAIIDCMFQSIKARKY